MYGKIFEEIFDGTLMAQGGPMATYTFMSMIVLADKDGIVNMSVEALGSRIGLPQGQGSFLEWEEFRRGLELLAQEDLTSNLNTENGRRIISMSEVTNGTTNRGWWIVNYDYYRKKASKFDVQEQTRERVRRFRDRECNAPVTHCNEKKGHTDTDTDTDKEILSGKKTRQQIPYKEIIDYLNKKTASNYKSTSAATKRSIKARFNEGFSVDDFKRVIDLKTKQWATDEKMVMYLRPITLFSTKFESYVNERPISKPKTKKVYL